MQQHHSSASGPVSAPESGRVAYFSMEIGLDPALPTYAGGLGVLAGDTLRAAADLRLPLVGVTLLHRKGYFRQRLGRSGTQHEEPANWQPADVLAELPQRAAVTVENKTVHIRAWRYTVRGTSGAELPVYFLDTNLPENGEEHRSLTDHLYGGDQRYRLCQEAVLGLGGVAMLNALGHTNLRVYHMNEGHSALLALALLEREPDTGLAGIQAVREHCVFTTHTPVPAGHDQFPSDLVRHVLGEQRSRRVEEVGCFRSGSFNMTHAALLFSRYVNGVAMRHGQISRGMFPDYPIASITNGVHAGTWTALPFQHLFDRHIPEWRDQNVNLRHAVAIPTHEVMEAHRRCKRDLLAEIERRSGMPLREDALTLGFARRATPYKRADMLLSDVDRLRALTKIGPLQIVYAGKAHPHDGSGKDIIRRIFAQSRQLTEAMPIVYLEEYDMALAKLLCAGVDVWINTPRQPQEASGTSGMKAALNGVPSLSVLDGWWIEGHVEGVTGWSIGEQWEPESDTAKEVAALYGKLEEIATIFFARPERFAEIMRHAISLNGSMFNAQRMVEQYAHAAYRLRAGER